MADPAPNTPTPGTEPGAAPAAPAGGTPNPPPAGGGAPAPKPGGKKGGSEVLHIPAKEFKKRLGREAAQMLQKELGISLEEAKRILGKTTTEPGAAPGAAPAGTSPAPGAAPAATSPETERLRLELKTAQETAEAEAKRRRKIARKAKESETQMQLRMLALEAGVKKDEIDYALFRYGRLVGATPENQEPIQPGKFFEAMRVSHPHVFAGAAPPAPVSLAPTTAPPESRQPGGVTPAPAKPGDPPKKKTVEEMNDAEFAAHTSSTYGYRPGAA